MNRAVDLHRKRVNPGGHLWVIAGWALLVLVYANVWAYTSTTANALVSSDAWHFVETFVPRALDGTVGIADLYAKRDGFDHAQPLNKLFLMINARYLGLDFAYEAFVGLVAAGAGLLVLKRAIDLEPHRKFGAGYWLPFAALAAVYMSLNSSEVFTWPLVTFGYVTILLALAAILAAWKAWAGQSRTWFAATMVACAALADDTAVVLAVSLAVTFLWAAARTGRLRHGATLAAIAVGIVAAYLLLYGMLDPSVRQASRPVGETLGRIVAQLSGPDRGGILSPLASGIAIYGQLEAHFGDGWRAVQLILGLVLLAAHGIFWWRALRAVPGPAAFASVSLMLLAYGYVGGILFARVPDAGLGYFNQARYALLYQLQVVAMLLLTFASKRTQAPQVTPVPGQSISLAFAALLLLIQVPLSMQTWREAQYNRHYWRQMAGQMMTLSREPKSVPTPCVANLVVCDWDAARRNNAIELLKRYRLNLFSPAFRVRHGFVDN